MGNLWAAGWRGRRAKIPLWETGCFSHGWGLEDLVYHYGMEKPLFDGPTLVARLFQQFFADPHILVYYLRKLK